MAKEGESIRDMAIHSAVIGTLSFLYMGIFGHKAPTKSNLKKGPFFRKK